MKTCKSHEMRRGIISSAHSAWCDAGAAQGCPPEHPSLGRKHVLRSMLAPTVRHTVLPQHWHLPLHRDVLCKMGRAGNCTALCYVHKGFSTPKGKIKWEILCSSSQGARCAQAIVRTWGLHKQAGNPPLTPMGDGSALIQLNSITTCCPHAGGEAAFA